MSFIFEQDQLEDYATIKQVFSKNECEQIIKYANLKQKNNAEINLNNETKKDSFIRQTKLAWISLDNCETYEMFELFKRFGSVAYHLNEQFFKFDLFGFSEDFQFCEYNAPNDKYDWHMDKCFGKGIRKLALTLQLNDPNEYEGGNFEIMTGKDPLTIKLEQGEIVAFPSYILHRVTEVTKGKRNSLVGWASGKSFK